MLLFSLSRPFTAQETFQPLDAIPLRHAYDLVNRCREFRETYGHNMIPIYVVAPAWTTMFILIRDMHKHPHVREINDLESQVDSADEASEDETESAFEEYVQLFTGAPLILPLLTARL